MNFIRNKWTDILIPVVLILFELIMSFMQYYQTSIDGDLVWHVLPYGELDKVLKDPLGLDAVINHNTYRGAGRWFCHWMTYNYFRSGYLFIDYFIHNKVTSLFLTSTLIQWFSQWLMIIAISLYINVTNKVTVRRFIWSAIICFFFFRYKSAYNIAIIDHAVTYTIFYAFPLSLLMLFLYPFFRLIFYHEAKQHFSIFKILLIFLLGLTLVFSGPLIPVLGFMFGSVILIILFLKNYLHNFSSQNIINTIEKINPVARLFLPLFIFLWLYDYYVGTFNNENTTLTTLAERYQLLWHNIPSYLFTGGLPYLLGLVVFNYILLRRYANDKLRTKEYFYFLIIAIAVIAYLFLIPFGGYRSYRPYIWRYDVTMPFTIFLIIVIIRSFYLLTSLLSRKPKFIFIGIVSVTLFIYWIQNFPIENTRSEQQQMVEILQNNKSDTVICLPYSSPFFDWNKIEDTARAYPVSHMLYEWGITQKPLKFYQR